MFKARPMVKCWSSLCLHPVLPPMTLYSVMVFLTVHVSRTPGSSAYSVGMEPRVHRGSISKVKLVDPCIDPIDFFLLVVVVVWLGTIVIVPCKLRRIHQAGYGYSVGSARVELLSQVHNDLGKVLVALHDEVPAVTLHRVIVA